VCLVRFPIIEILIYLPQASLIKLVALQNDT